jgi:glycosyltransferase involved in cell wall biosynthesis
VKVVIYFLHNPWPPKSGAHHRCLQILRGLRQAECKVILASSTLHTEQPWTYESKDALREITGHDVKIFEAPGKVTRNVDRIQRKLRRWGFYKGGISETFFCPYSLVSWFRAQVREFDPNVVLITYAWFDQLVDHRLWRDRYRVMETIDLLSINQQMWRYAQAQVDQCSNGGSALKLKEEFDAAKSEFRLDPEEVEIYRRYDTVSCISLSEKTFLDGLVPRSRVVHVPFVHETFACSNTYAGPPFLSLGPNPFNMQGYLYFVDAVLPLIKTQLPGFKLIVTGSIRSAPRRAPGIDWRGFVDNREPLFREAGYSVCPVFAGTGQQIKIVEAMAYGVAVVAFEGAARTSFIRNEENGLIAKSAREFADHVVRLECDRNLRARLGCAAKVYIGEEYEKHKGLPGLIETLK